MIVKKSEGVFFSVIIPCYNSEKTIAQTINSCMNQSFSDFEILIIDDASQDETIAVVTNLARSNSDVTIKISSLKKNSGPSVCRNLGWKMAKGKFIAFLDADDVWHLNKLEVCYSWLNKLNCDLLAHSYNEGSNIDNNKLKFESYCAKEKTYYDLLIKNISQTSCIVVRNELNNVEKFDSRMRYTEDHELWLRISYSKSVYFLCGEALTNLGRPQLTKGGLSGNRWAMRKGEMLMLMKSTAYSKFSLFMLPLLIIYSFIKFMKKEISILAKDLL
jgi:teichuronic acid biosynthesis glycosyltransferase TuaG